MTPAYHKKEGAIPHPGTRKHSLQYEGRPDGLFGVWVWTWNIGSLCGNVCEELKKSMIDVCCLEVEKIWC